MTLQERKEAELREVAFAIRKSVVMAEADAFVNARHWMREAGADAYVLNVFDAKVGAWMDTLPEWARPKASHAIWRNIAV